MEVNSPSLSQALFDFHEGPERFATDFQPKKMQPSGRQAALKKGMKQEEIERIKTPSTRGVGVLGTCRLHLKDLKWMKVA